MSEEEEIKSLQNEIYGSVSKEKWFVKYWRPLAAIEYLIICLFDFMIAPILMGVYAGYTGTKLVQWQTLTTQGGGLFHLAFLTILGLYTWGRTQEKIMGIAAKDTRPRFEDDDDREEYINKKRARLKELLKKKREG